MIKYDWEKIKKICEYKEENILMFFFLKRSIRIPTHLGHSVPKKLIDLAILPYPSGDSYILNIDKLLTNATNYTIKDLFIYIKLASERSLFDYKIRGIKSLPLAFVETAELDFVKRNPLLIINDDEIQFIYE